MHRLKHGERAGYRAAYVKDSGQRAAEAEALQAALTQLELSTRRAERALDSALAEVRASLQASS